jgi:hypothetical protein
MPGNRSGDKKKIPPEGGIFFIGSGAIELRCPRPLF